MDYDIFNKQSLNENQIVIDCSSKKGHLFLINSYYLWADWAICTIINIETVSNQVLEMIFEEPERQIDKA